MQVLYNQMHRMRVSIVHKSIVPGVAGQFQDVGLEGATGDWKGRRVIGRDDG